MTIRFAMACAALLGAADLTGFASAQAAQTAAAPDQAAVTSLAAAVEKAMAALPATATVDDIEGAIAYTIDQSGQDETVVIAAINQVSPRSAKERTAVANFKRRRVKRGAGTGSGTGGVAQSSVTALGSGPAVAGGGTSDYSQTN